MSRISTILNLTNKNITAIAIIVASVAAAGGIALAAQDRSTLKVPNGLAFSEFKGYENWETVAVSQTETSVKMISANPAMIKAYRSGVPGNGKKFPEGSKIVKIEWLSKKNTESPYAVNGAGHAENAVVHRKRLASDSRTRMAGPIAQFHERSARPTR